MSQGRLASNLNPPPRDPLARLFAGSSLVGWTDGELLARFVADRDELAFEGLVVRLGPMVLGVCRRMLGVRGEVDDAFQATFLVLVRRARSVGRGDLIGPWLHGVAVRVCRQARARQARRRVREQTGMAVDELIDRSADSASRVDQAETRTLIDDAIARLPEGYRRLVILCDVEGLSRDEAADRLGWTANMVRGRLARARSRLRARLVRRGCVPPGLTVEAGSGLGIGLWVGKVAPSPVLVATTARVALLFDSPTGRQVAATLAASSALPLASGVLRVMFYSSWKLVGTSLLLGGSLVGGAAGVLLAQGPASNTPAATQSPQRRPDGSVKPPSAADQYKAAEALYDAAVRQLSSDLMISPQQTSATRRAAVKAYESRIRQIQKDQVREFGSGQATQDLFTNAMRTVAGLLAREDAGVEAARIDAVPGASIQTLLEERLWKARYRDALQSGLNPDASRHVMEADLTLAKSPDQRRAIIQTYVNQLTQIHEREFSQFELGSALPADLAESAEALLEARIMLAKEIGGSSTGASLRSLLEERLQKARERQSLQAAFYEEGRITIDRLIAAKRRVLEADLALAENPDQRRAIIQNYVDQLKRILDRETAELELGRATSADVAEAAEALLEARIMLARESGSAPDKPTPGDRPDGRIAEFDRRLSELERKLDRVLESLAKEGGASRRDQGPR